jgi:uncharacterized protein DUF1579
MRSPTKLFCSLLASASSLIVARAESQHAPPKPGPEVQKLAVTVGKFANEGAVKAGAMGANSPAMKVHGTDECRWIAGGFGLLCTETVAFGDRRDIETAVTYYNPDSKKYEYHGVRSSGEITNQTGTVTSDTWTWLGEGVMAGHIFHVRYIQKFVSNDAYEYTEDWGDGDKPMEPGMSGTDTRVAATKPEVAKPAQ